MNKDVYIDLQLYNISKITPVSFLGHSVLGLNHSQTPEIFRRELSPPSRVCGELYVLLCHWTQASRREIIQMNYRLSVDERQTNGACRLRLAIPLVRLPISLHIHEHLTGWPDSDRFCHPTRINASTATPHCGPSYSNTRWLVHWPLMGGLLHLVQRVGAWAGSVARVHNMAEEPQTSVKKARL